MTCTQCGGPIPTERYHKYRKHTKYCSTLCNYRAWYLRQNSAKVHTIGKGPNLTTNTGKGLYWELHAQTLIGGRVLALERMNGEADIVLSDGRRVDVKSANLYRRKNKRGKPVNPAKQSGWWVFNRNGEKLIDSFLCIGLIDNQPQEYYLIPARHFPHKTAVITMGSTKYGRFRIDPNEPKMS